MIYTNNSSKKSLKTDLFKSENVGANGMSELLPFIVCGNGPEPKNVWNNNEGRYSDDIDSWGIWVCQNAVDEETGERFVQNPILVEIPVESLDEEHANKFKFGDLVKLCGMGGFKSFKYKNWRWRADSIELIKGGKK